MQDMTTLDETDLKNISLHKITIIGITSYRAEIGHSIVSQFIQKFNSNISEESQKTWFGISHDGLYYFL